jgi:glutamyl-tRNA synthetase
MKDIAQPARVALTGRSVSPGIYEVLAVLGKDESLARIDRGIELSRA